MMQHLWTFAIVGIDLIGSYHGKTWLQTNIHTAKSIVSRLHVKFLFFNIIFIIRKKLSLLIRLVNILDSREEGQTLNVNFIECHLYY